jgi:hypothetical protein
VVLNGTATPALSNVIGGLFRPAPEQPRVPLAETQLDSTGPPVLYFNRHGNLFRQNALLTISHDGDYASAVCLALGPPSFDAVDQVDQADHDQSDQSEQSDQFEQSEQSDSPQK